jgi:hypothetical protein
LIHQTFGRQCPPTSKVLFAKFAIVLFIAAALFTPASTKAFKQLQESYARILGTPNSSAAWLKERGGEFVLPPRVQTIIRLLREHRIENFRYGLTIAQDPDPALVQRLAEGAYPIRLNAQAKHVVFTTRDTVEPSCQKIAGKDDFILAYCP